MNTGKSSATNSPTSQCAARAFHGAANFCGFSMDTGKKYVENDENQKGRRYGGRKPHILLLPLESKQKAKHLTSTLALCCRGISALYAERHLQCV